nr:hypothetical protein pmam_430 [Pithovirus mammoth]
MTIPTLRSLILNELSFESLLEFEKDPNFSPYLGWEFWAEKLEKERQIPKEYFYLVRKQWTEKAGLIERETSPSGRYLELASEFEFFPQSESLRKDEVNLERSLDRGDEEEILYWVSRLSEEDLKAVKKRFSSSFNMWITPNNFVGFRILHKILFGKERYYVVNGDGMVLTWQDGDNSMKEFSSRELSGFLLYQQEPEFIFKKDIVRNFNQTQLNCYLKTQPVNENPYSSRCRNYAIELLIISGNFQALEKAIELCSEPEPKSEMGNFLDPNQLFCCCLESGKIEMVDIIFPIYASWRAEEMGQKVWSGKVSELIPQIEFDVGNNCDDFSKGGKYDLSKSHKPGWEFGSDYEAGFLVYAVRSGNPQMVDLICSLQGIELSEELFNDYEEGAVEPLLEELFNSAENNPTKFFGFYQILQRILPSEYPDIMEISPKNFSLDMMNLILSRDWNRECLSYFTNEFIHQTEGEFSKQNFLSKLEDKHLEDSEELSE